MEHFDYALFSATLLGSFAMYVFSLQRGFAGAVAFLRKMFPDHSQVFYDRLDFFLVTITGSVIGFILFDPQRVHQALVAGLGWVSAVNVVMNKIDGA